MNITYLAVGAIAGIILGILITLFHRKRTKEPPQRGGIIGAVILGGVIGLIGGQVVSGFFIDTEDIKSLPHVDSAEAFAEQVHQAERPVLVNVYHPSCRYCEIIAPTIGKLSEEYERRIDFIMINAASAGDLLAQLGVDGYPTILLFSQGQERERLRGVQAEQTLREAMDKLLFGEPTNDDSQDSLPQENL
jgi:thioredoxin 1